MSDLMAGWEVPGRCELGELKSSREWVIASSLMQIQPVVREALEELGERSDLDALELALHEALVNAIEHGNQESVSKSVRVTLARCNSGAVVVAVKDCGNGFSIGQTPDPLGDGLMRERGRGIFLMRQLVAGVDFVFDQGVWGNSVSGVVFDKALQKRLPTPNFTNPTSGGIRASGDREAAAAFRR